MNKDIIEKKAAIDVNKLEDAYDLGGLIGEIGNMYYEGVGQNSYVDMSIEYLEDYFYDIDYEGEQEYLVPTGNIDENPSLYKVYQLMKNGELPEEFYLLIWW